MCSLQFCTEKRKVSKPKTDVDLLSILQNVSCKGANLHKEFPKKTPHTRSGSYSNNNNKIQNFILQDNRAPLVSNSLTFDLHTNQHKACLWAQEDMRPELENFLKHFVVSAGGNCVSRSASLLPFWRTALIQSRFCTPSFPDRFKEEWLEQPLSVPTPYFLKSPGKIRTKKTLHAVPSPASSVFLPPLFTPAHFNNLFLPPLQPIHSTAPLPTLQPSPSIYSSPTSLCLPGRLTEREIG